MAWTWQGWMHLFRILFEIVTAIGLARILVVRFDQRGLLPDLEFDDKGPVIEVDDDNGKDNGKSAQT
jgi:hypothetical protein